MFGGYQILSAPSAREGGCLPMYMSRELDGLKAPDILSPLTKPADRKDIVGGTKWIFRWKCNKCG